MCVWGGGGGGGAGGFFYVVVFNTIFANSELNTKSFSCQTNRNWKNNILTRMFSYLTLKVNLCTSRRTQLQQN